MEIKEIILGIVYEDFHHPQIEYIVLSVDLPMVEVERVTCRQRGYSNRCKVYFTCFEFITPIRTMDEMEVQKYIDLDPVVYLEKGIYKMLTDLVDISLKDLAAKDSIICISDISCSKIPASESFELYMCFQHFEIDAETEATIIAGSKDECMDLYWKIMKRIIIS